MHTTTDAEFKARQRAMWAAGDYHGFATKALWELGPLLVAACGIAPGQRVLDVAAGTGNVAIRAAAAGASVVASDLTPENFDAGRREAAAHGVEVEWVEADAEELPFGDGEFDVVTSSFGVIFAPHHQRVADELVRVCRPGGTIGLIALAPTGAALELFDLVARYAPSPLVSAESPLRWGAEAYVRRLFGERVEWRSFERRPLGPNILAGDVGFMKRSHPMLVTLARDLAGDAEREAALDRRLDALQRHWEHEPQEIAVYVARTRAG